MSPRRILIALAILSAIASQAFPADRAAMTAAGIDGTETRITHTIDGSSGEYYVHTFVLDLVGLERLASPARVSKGMGTPVYRVVHTSEGPYSDTDSRARVQEIVKDGLLIGTHFWPLDRIQRVEVRSN